MKQFDSFIFEKCTFDADAGKISLCYSLDDDVHFEEVIEIPKQNNITIRRTQDDAILQKALQALHLAGGTSYYKTCCPKRIDVGSDELNEDEAEFWNTVYTKGLGEFFYENDIDFRSLVKFPSKLANKKIGDGRNSANPLIRNHKRILVPIGGGKDSLVTIELLRKSGVDITLLRMGSHPLIDEMVKVSGLPCITVKRSLSANLFELNDQGALNGHIPITAYLSCLSVFLAELYGFDAVVLSNERSASEGNTQFHGEEVNHQWSKSFEFEHNFCTYLQSSIQSDISYFSMLRPWSELNIVQEFCSYNEYLSLFTSCNRNWGILNKKSDQKKWCGECPKCSFAFALTAAFLPEEILTNVYDGNFYESSDLLPLYKQLLGLEGFKPFECVGTPEETQAAFYLAHKRGDLDDTVAMKVFIEDVLPNIEDPEVLVRECFEPSEEHCIPTQFQSLLYED